MPTAPAPQRNEAHTPQNGPPPPREKFWGANGGAVSNAGGPSPRPASPLCCALIIAPPRALGRGAGAAGSPCRERVPVGPRGARIAHGGTRFFLDWHNLPEPTAQAVERYVAYEHAEPCRRLEWLVPVESPHWEAVFSIKKEECLK